MCWRSVVAIALLLSIGGATSRAQDVIKVDRVGLGGSEPSGTSAIIATPASIPANTAGQNLIFIDGSGLFRKGTLAKGDLPATTVFTDQVNTFGAFLQTFNGGITSAANITITAANDLIIGTGGIRAGSGAVLIRDVLDASTTASFGDSAIALNNPTTITGNLTVTSGDIIAPEIRAASGSFLIRNVADGGTTATFGDASINLDRNTTVTGTFGASGNATFGLDVAVDGGDITSSAANLNITPGSSITLNRQTRLAASHTLQSANFTSRTTGWGITYAGEADFRYTYADEFYTKNFIADLETALNGGQIIAKSTVIVAQNFTCPAAGGTATLWVRDFPGHGNLRVFAASDWVVLRSMTRADADNDGNIEFSIGDCVGQVSAYTDGTSANEGTQSWTFTRGSGGNAGAMAASTVVAADAVVIDFGVSGQGFLVARANDGTEGSQSPYWQVVTWTTAPVAANMTVQTRFGQLNGSYGYSAAAYGFAAGSATGANVTIEATNGVRIRSGTTVRGAWDSAGTITLGETGAGQENLVISSTSLAARVGTDNYLAVNSTDGVVVGQPAVSGLGWLQITPTGSLFLNSGTATRLALASSNGALTLYDDDGSTVRTQIGATAAVFGGTTGARLQYTYSSGLFEAYDGAGTRQLWWDSANGLVLGQGANGSGKPYAQLTSTSLLFCEDGGTCPLAFNGSTGDITSTGNFRLSTGGNITSTGNFELSNANGLTFAASAAYSAPKAITWGTTSDLSGSTDRIWGASATYGQLNFLSRGTSMSGARMVLASNAAGEHVLMIGGTGTSSAPDQVNRIRGGILDGTNILGGQGANWQIYVDAPAATPSGTGNKVLLVDGGTGRIQYANAGFTGSCSGVPNSVINGLIMSC